MFWNFIGVYIINRTLHGRLEIRNISVRPCSILYLFTSKQRKVGSRKRETGEPDLADFIFKMAGRVMADDYHIYRTASHPNVFLSRCQFTRKGRQEFSPL